jgi:hypothetical protein
MEFLGGLVLIMIMKFTQYKPLASPGFTGQEGFFLCYALLLLGCLFKMVHWDIGTYYFFAQNAFRSDPIGLAGGEYFAPSPL